MCIEVSANWARGARRGVTTILHHFKVLTLTTNFYFKRKEAKNIALKENIVRRELIIIFLL